MLKLIETQIRNKYKTWTAYEHATGLTTRNGKRRLVFLLSKLSTLLKPLGLKIKIEEEMTFKIFLRAKRREGDNKIYHIFYSVETNDGEFKSSILENAILESKISISQEAMNGIVDFSSKNRSLRMSELSTHDILLYDFDDTQPLGLTIKIEEENNDQ